MKRRGKILTNHTKYLYSNETTEQVFIGTYYYDDKVNKTNGEFDIALNHGKEYTIFESKYLQNKMPLSLMHHKINQIESIKEIKIKNIGFISINGFEKKEEGCYYIDGEDLYDF